MAAGLFAYQSDVPVYSLLFLLELKALKKEAIKLVNALFDDGALCISEGSVDSE